MSFPRLLLEPLEPRIAPAVILAGPTAYGGVQYNSTGGPFHDASSVPHTGSFDNSFTDGKNYYVQLKSGDTLKIYNNGSAFTTFLTVTGGTVDAFFTDSISGVATGVPTASELTGLSVSAGAKFSLAGNVYGDIVANLNAKTGLIDLNDLVSNAQNIGSIGMTGYNVGGTFDKTNSTPGSIIPGSIIAGGGIANVSMGAVTAIQSGLNGASATAYHWAGTTASTATLTAFGADSTTGNGLLPAAGKVGGNLSNISISTAAGLYGGNGGAGASGGSVSNITVTSDATGLALHGGDGGAGASLTAAKGGAGGQVSQVTMYGVTDSTDNSLIQISGGAGGSAFSGSTGTGGNGGAVNKVSIGYQPSSTAAVDVATLLHDNITVQGGAGGAGATAGNGGNVSNATLLSATPYSDPLTPGLHDIQVLGGAGGDMSGFVGKKAGMGGSVTSFNIQDIFDTTPVNPSAGASTVFVAGGDASASSTVSSGTGAAGGSITNPVTQSTPWLVGQNFIFQGGHGSDTQSGGGAGGSVSNLQFGIFSDTTLLQNLTVTGGAGGGDSTLIGNAGAGGSISGISAPNSALGTLSTDTLTLHAGNGGLSGNVSAGGLGGAGGSISSVDFFDSGAGTYVPIAPSAGVGGDGFKGGGAGGSIKAFHYFLSSTTTDLASLTATAGNGGSALGTGINGNGGAGGAISGIAFQALVPDFSGHTQDVSLIGGTGGNAVGSGAAGAGGAITQANVLTLDGVTFTAGNGGNSGGDKGKIGSGGSIGSSSSGLGVSAQSSAGFVTYQAGQAGSAASGTPSTGGAGGSITNAIAAALGDISFLAGNASIGGAGGNISTVAFHGSSGTATSSDGNILVVAGTGGNAISTGSAGRGGSLTNVSGYTSLGNSLTTTVKFVAGDGGVASTGTGGAGGSVTGLSLLGGKNTSNFITFNDTTNTSTTIDGGTPTVVTTFNTSSFTDTVTNVGTDAFLVVAGNGGAGGKVGGLGGSVNNVFSNPVTVETKTTVYNTTDNISVVKTTSPVTTTTTSSSKTTSSQQLTDVYVGAVANAIAAGDGGAVTTGKGAAGGSVTNVRSDGDIGVRTGKAYGFDSSSPTADPSRMGGIFAGAGGTGTTGAGTAGNVTNITAQSIAAIVAGRAASPQLVNKVDAIMLNGDTAVTENASTGAYTNFTTANLVGGKESADPTSTNAVNFQTNNNNFSPSGTSSYAWTLGTPGTPGSGTIPLDGLIAAVTLTSNRNFTPLAFLTNAGTTTVPDYELYVTPVPAA